MGSVGGGGGGGGGGRDKMKNKSCSSHLSGSVGWAAPLQQSRHTKHRQKLQSKAKTNPYTNIKTTHLHIVSKTNIQRVSLFNTAPNRKAYKTLTSGYHQPF